MIPSDDLDLKRALEALPRTVEPPGDLWPELRSRITREAAVPERRPRFREFHWPEHFEPRTIRIAAGIAAIGIGLTYLAAATRANAHWMLSQWEVQRGVPWARANVAQDSLLHAGAVVQTSGREAAVVAIGHIGRVDVRPGTRLRMIRATATDQRLALDVGQIGATVTAPPRLFAVETPSGVATDMGCSYTLTVDSTGASTLLVTGGWATFDERGREALIPQGFRVVTLVNHDVGTPVSERSLSRRVAPFPGSAKLMYADLVALYDAGDHSDSLVTRLLTDAQRFDAVTLWHLMPKVDAARRARVYDRLAALAPPPPGVTRAGVLAGSTIMMRLWWEKLPGTLPITPDVTKRLWMLWLKAASWL